MRLLYDFTGGHLWGFLKRDLLRLFKGESLEVEDIYFMNLQPLIPLKLRGSGWRAAAKRLVDFVNGFFLHRRKACYGPNIVIKFRRPL